jgi:Tol biopolymer transport system component
MDYTQRLTMRCFISINLLALILGGCASPATVADVTSTSQGVAEETGAGETPGAQPPVSTMSPEQALELSELGRIAFTASEGGRRDVFVITPDGRDEINLTGELTNTFAEAPVWSPDGTLIAFDGIPNSDSLRDVYVVTVNGQSEQTDLTNRPDGYDCYPSFSPDGQQIVYMSERNGIRDLYVMDLQGNDLLRLTENERRNYEPAWSPDGERIAFTSTRDGNSEIYVMDAGLAARLVAGRRMDRV